MKKLRFIVIDCVFQERFELSTLQAAIVAEIHQLQNNQTQFCYKSKAAFAATHRVTRQSIHNQLIKLIEKGILEKNELGHLRVIEGIGYNEQSSQPMQNLHSPHAEEPKQVTTDDKKSPLNKVHADDKKSLGVKKFDTLSNSKPVKKFDTDSQNILHEPVKKFDTKKESKLEPKEEEEHTQKRTKKISNWETFEILLTVQASEGQTKQQSFTAKEILSYSIDAVSTFSGLWGYWLAYRVSLDKSYPYVSEASEKTAKAKLIKLAGGDPSNIWLIRAIVSRSIENGWKGFFPLPKDEKISLSGQNPNGLMNYHE